jgi:hypothetical protein
VRRMDAFGADDQSFNLPNVKYLLYERRDIEGGAASIEGEGIRSMQAPMYLKLERSGQIDSRVSTTANELAIISAMGNSPHIPRTVGRDEQRPATDSRIQGRDSGRTARRKFPGLYPVASGTHRVCRSRAQGRNGPAHGESGDVA